MAERDAAPRLTVRDLRDSADMRSVVAIRRQVFVVEQGVATNVEPDNVDRVAHHVLGLVDDRVVGVGRLHITANEGQIAWVAVLPDYRHLGVGRAIMRRLLTVREPGALMVLGIVDVDLFVPDSQFVYGEADRESKSGVFSVFRLKTENQELLKRRSTIEAVHQAGHLVGLSYCEDVRCTMFFATSLTDCDRRNLGLCNNCRNELNKLRR